MAAKQGSIDFEAKEVVKRLDALIAVTLATVGRDRQLTTRDKILTPRSAGLGPSEIGRIVGVPTSYVTSTFAQTRKRKTEEEPLEKEKIEGQ